MLALAVDRTDPNVVWAGAATGGLWKLTITGEGEHDYHWEYVDTGLPVLGVRTIAIDRGYHARTSALACPAEGVFGSVRIAERC